MSLQIKKLILYSRNGDIREVEFKIGQLNILTGASKTGKSAIIDIIDYVTGRGECNVADGVIRKYVGWYAILFQLNDAQIFIARRNPDIGERTHSEAYLQRGTTIKTPQLADLIKNTTVSAVEKFLGAVIGISENEHRPPQPTRDSLEANFRHALILSLQDQNDIDSKHRLFHRQGEEYVGQAIRDTLPYFLGAVDEDHLLKQAQLDQARRQLRQLERQARDVKILDNQTYPRAQSLLDESKQVGLVDERTVAMDYASARDLLSQVLEDSNIQDNAVIGDGEDLLAKLRAERQGLRSELERVNAEIRSARTFTSETSNYERETKEQRARLSAVGLVNRQHDSTHCPLCESRLTTPPPTVVEIKNALADLTDQLLAVEAENPRLQMRLATLIREEGVITERLKENQQRIANRIQENEITKAQQETFILQARTLGKISQYLEASGNAITSSRIDEQIQAAQMRVATLEQALDPDTIREKLAAFLNIIGTYMTRYSEQVDLEHRGSELRLDIRIPTVVADTLDGPVPLFRMGSGENWVGYHVLAHLALHKFFRQKNRPVAGFLIFDQPSQAHYPPEKDNEGSLEGLNDEDQAAVTQLFKLISDAAADLAPHLQIIVMDHADLKHTWFEDAVAERWRRGKKLIPESWIL